MAKTDWNYSTFYNSVQVRLKNKHSVHSDGRTAAIVPEDDCVVAFLLPRRGEQPTTSAIRGEQQQSAARVHITRETSTQEHADVLRRPLGLRENALLKLRVTAVTQATMATAAAASLSGAARN